MLVVGLGNPGAQYQHTRHNIGFDVVEALAEREGLLFRKPMFRHVRVCSAAGITIAEPLTYMNNSGRVLPWLFRRYDCNSGDLVVVTDNLDLPPGKLRLKRGGTSRSHRGIASVWDTVNSPDFVRLYVGIGRPKTDSPPAGASTGSRDGVVEHVLSRPAEGDAVALREALPRAVEALQALRSRNVEEVMNELNRSG